MSREHSARLGEEDSAEYAGSNGGLPTLAEILQSPKEGNYVLDMFESNPVRKSPNAFVLSFKNLTYSINPPGNIELPAIFCLKNKQKQGKLLLNDISGEAREGEILAVLGASGSGKSTLIDALANRITKESLKGTVNLNGVALESKLLKVISAYVMQDDLLYPMLTVEETLMFAAEFRLPRSLGKPMKQERVKTLMDQLGLRRSAKTIIGDEGHRGISGGERRRVSIGIDIIHDPIMLFLDEPTSGLDSTSAFLVTQVLKRIALSGSIVIMSIHQPSYRILGILDRMIFLSRGQVVFNDSPKNLQPFFSDFGHPIPENESHTEFALDMIRLHEASPGGVKCLVQFNQSWQKKKSESGLSDNFTLSLNEAIHARILSGKLVFESNQRLESSSTSPIRQGFANSFWNEMWALSKRSAINMCRAPELFGLRLATVLITAFILSTIYWKLDETPKGVQERLGFFAFAISTTFYTCADALPVFLQERYIFVRETSYNAYRRSSYVIANSIVALPSLIILSSAFSIVTFWAVGLAGGISGFFYYFFIVLSSFWAGNSFVTFLSGVVGNVTMGYTAVVAGLAYYLLVSGFFINRDRIPLYWIWFHYLSVIKYPYEGILKNEFMESIRCFATGSEIFDTTPLRGVGSNIKDAVLKGLSAAMDANITGSTCMTTGIDILKQQSISGMSKWNCLIATVAWGFLFRVLFYLALLFGVKNKRM